MKLQELLQLKADFLFWVQEHPELRESLKKHEMNLNDSILAKQEQIYNNDSALEAKIQQWKTEGRITDDN